MAAKHWLFNGVINLGTKQPFKVETNCHFVSEIVKQLKAVILVAMIGKEGKRRGRPMHAKKQPSGHINQRQSRAHSVIARALH